MSLSASLRTAVSGLGLSSRRAEIIATNVANADTPGYARRRLVTGGTASANVSVSREVDPALLFLRRDAQSGAAGASIGQAFHASLESAIGDPDQSGSLQDLLARLDAAFTSAAADPTSATRLGAISGSAHDLAQKLNALGSQVTGDRQSAEGRIGKTVDRLNTDLASVSKLNADIIRTQATGGEVANLLDQRQALVDLISKDIPLRELPRDNGAIALVSRGGVILLDGGAAKIGFSERTLIQPEMTYPDELSGLTVNERAVGTGVDGDGLAGGALGALFNLRDDLATTAMDRLDAFAADLGARFQDPAVDPTLAALQPGIFTDAGASIDTGDITGLAGRISVNAAVAPGQTDSHWRLRDGLGAPGPGPTSNQSQLLRYSAALGSTQAPASAALGGNPDDMAGLGASLRSALSLDRVAATDAYDRLAIQEATLVDMRDGAKVDVDEEMRRLIEVEQAYAANARLVQAVGQMMDRLTEI